jgi:hypothetical protein
MLRDLHDLINTTGSGCRKLLPYQHQLTAMAFTSFGSILLHHLKHFFVTSVIGLLLRAEAGRRLPVVEENATNDGKG